MSQSKVIIHLIDPTTITNSNISSVTNSINRTKNKYPNTECIVVLNKMDVINDSKISTLLLKLNPLKISAKNGNGIDKLKVKLLDLIKTGKLNNNDTIITNVRHYNALLEALKNIKSVQKGLLSGVSGDLLAIDIRQVLYHFGCITGEISTDDLLGNIFSNFCIGK